MKAFKSSNESRKFTRREFLKLSGLGIFAAFGLSKLQLSEFFLAFDYNNPIYNLYGVYDPSISYPQSLSPNQQGRVLSNFVNIYDQPTFSSTKINRYWRDAIIPITSITIGKAEDSFNLVWYKIGDEGYTHSGEIQPVLTITNPVIKDIPKGGALAEVTVPYTDAHWDPASDEPVAYRFYFSTTHWVTEIIQDTENIFWYGVKDDKWDYTYYVPTQHLRLIPTSELKPLSPGTPADQKRIEIHLQEQVMIAFEYDQPVYMARTATGALFSNGDYSTPTGRYVTFHKRFSRHMARGNLAANGYDLPGVPWNSYITEEGIAFHGTYWHNNFGRPRSHGCINLSPQAAKWVFLWTMPSVSPGEEFIYKDTGTQVVIID